jgi:hypothetical protein
MAEKQPAPPEPAGPAEAPAAPAEDTRRRGLLARLFGVPEDTPDRQPDDWLFEDSTGYRIPFQGEPPREEKPGGPAQESAEET